MKIPIIDKEIEKEKTLNKVYFFKQKNKKSISYINKKPSNIKIDYKDLSYNDIFSFKNLYLAYLKARKSKRHKKDVIEFEISLNNNIYSLHKELLNKTYIISPYHHFYIYEPKKREIQALTYKDRVVQHALCDNYLMPFLKKRLIYDNCACIENKGTDFARNRLKSFLHSFFINNKNNNGYFLKCDIKKYFNSIDHNILKSILNKEINNKEILEFLYLIIDSYCYSNNKGIPMGNQTSQCFALLYLDKIDRIIKEKYRIKYYTRYMDDLIIIHKDKEYLEKLLNEITIVLKNDRKLVFNNKTKIERLNLGIEYLGSKYYLLNNGKIINVLLKHKKNRIIHKLKLNKNSFIYYKSYIERFDCFKLKKKILEYK